MVAVVLHTPGMPLSATLAALGRQVYKPDSVLVIGSADALDDGASELSVTALAAVSEVLPSLPNDASYVWWLHADTRPRPDALRALVEEAGRHDAGVAGSKVLIEGAGDRLGSVGAATDAFGEPYSGLDPGELDLEQYDVVREVAFVSPVSMLIRRDLLRGLGGLDGSLPAQAAGLDISQRARLAGAKVMVVPSSEVFHRAECPADRPGWRQLAGRYRAMLVAYRPVTLAWVLPMGLVAALLDVGGQLLLGRVRRAGSYLLAWLWNVIRLPSTWSLRRGTRRIRQVGDEELFRFQVAGSVRVRETAAELGERISAVLEAGDEVSDRSRAVWKRPTFLLALAALVVLLAGTRTLWLSGLPQSGFALLPSSDPWPALTSWAGGWQSSGLGSPNPPPPVVAMGAAATLITGGRPGLAATLITMASLIGGFVGVIRLGRRHGFEYGAGYLGGFVYLGGLAASALFGAGHWPLLLAAGPLPWAIDAATAPRPPDMRRAAGLLARGGLAASLTAAAFPPALAIVLVGGSLLAVMKGAWKNVARAIGIFVLGAIGIAPWVIGGEVMALVNAAPVPPFDPIWPWATTIALATIAAAWAAPRHALPATGFGAIAAVGGWLLAFLPPLPPGIGLAGLLAAALGSGFLAASLFGSGKARWSRLAAMAGLLVLVVPVLFTVGRGRAGLPADQWSRKLDFVGAISEGAPLGRVLMIGAPGELPGSTRPAGSVVYRLIEGEGPTLEQAYLPGPRDGDRALRLVLTEVATANSLRPGAALAQFAVSWLVVMPGSSVLDDALDRQIDLSPLLVDAELRAYANRSPAPRALARDGTVWRWNGRWYEGPPAPDRIRLADNADSGWGPDWSQEGWANSVSTESGRARYLPDPLLFWAAVAGGLGLLTMGVLGYWGRSSPTRPAHPGSVSAT